MADAVIVGAGVIGLSVAIALRDLGLEVSVLEKSMVGSEASQAAAGMLSPQLEAVDDGPVFRLGRYGLDLYADWVAELEVRSGLSVGYRRDGGVQVFQRAEDLEVRARSLAWQSLLGLRWTTVDSAALRALVPGVGAFEGAIYFPDEAQVEPKRLVRALARAAQRSGVQIHERALVHRIVASDSEVRGVELPDRKLRADVVVLTAGAWSSQVVGSELQSPSVTPIRGQMVALRPPRSPLGPFVCGSNAYVVPRSDGRVLVGATVERVGYNNSTTLRGIRQLLDAGIELRPDLIEADFVECWAGLRPMSFDKKPIVGRTAVQGLFIATGHYRAGILTAPATAAVIAALVEGRDPAIPLHELDPRRPLSSTHGDTDPGADTEDDTH